MRIINGRYDTNVFDWYLMDFTDKGLLYTQKFIIVNTPNKINKDLIIHNDFPDEYLTCIEKDMNYLIDKEFNMYVSIIGDNIFVLCIYIN